MDEIDLPPPPQKKRQKVYDQTGNVDDIAYIRNIVGLFVKRKSMQIPYV